jgi:hypothetical protein
MFADPAHAVTVPATITCSDSLGNTNQWKVQWDNANQYFSDKGNIAAHFCEGGFAGAMTTFVSVVGANGNELDQALLYFNGIVPEPETPAPPVEATEDVERVTEEVIREPEAPVVEPEAPVVEPPAEEVIEQPEEIAPVTPEPPVSQPEPVLPEPEPEPIPEQPVSPVETITPETGESPQPEPAEPPVSPVQPEISPEVSVQPQINLAEAFGALINAFQSAGLDMTEEQRERAQSVVIPSVMVALVATTSMIRK